MLAADEPDEHSVEDESPNAESTSGLAQESISWGTMRCPFNNVRESQSKTVAKFGKN